MQISSYDEKEPGKRCFSHPCCSSFFKITFINSHSWYKEYNQSASLPLDFHPAYIVNDQFSRKPLLSSVLRTTVNSLMGQQFVPITKRTRSTIAFGMAWLRGLRYVALQEMLPLESNYLFSSSFRLSLVFVPMHAPRMQSQQVGSCRALSNCDYLCKYNQYMMTSSISLTNKRLQ